MTTTNPSAPYFDKVANQWDNLRTGYFTEAVRDAAIAKAYLHPEMSVADIGAGTGFVSAGLAPLVKKVHVLDGSAAMLEIARKNLAQFDNMNFRLRMGCPWDYWMPARTQSLQICICTTVLIRWLPSAKWFEFFVRGGDWC